MLTLFNLRSPGGSAAVFGVCAAPLDYFGVALISLLLPVLLAAQLAVIFALHRAVRFVLMMCGCVDESSLYQSSSSSSSFYGDSDENAFSLSRDVDMSPGDNNDDNETAPRNATTDDDSVDDRDLLTEPSSRAQSEANDNAAVPQIVSRAYKSDGAIMRNNKKKTVRFAEPIADDRVPLIDSNGLPIGGSQPAMKLGGILSSRLPNALLVHRVPHGHADQRFFSLDRMLRTLTLFVLLSYSSLLQTTLSILSCYEVGNLRVLADAPAIQCKGDEYERWSSAATVVLLPLLALFPVLLFGALVWLRRRHKLYNAKTSERIASLDVRWGGDHFSIFEYFFKNFIFF